MSHIVKSHQQITNKKILEWLIRLYETQSWRKPDRH